MPEQSSGRGDAVTKAPFTGAFETILIPYGQAKLNLKDDIAAMEASSFPRLTNLDNDQDGRLIQRLGQTALATAGTQHHSVRKLRDPQAGNFTRIWGIDNDLYIGMSGALTSVDNGYSGTPLALTPHRPPLSGDPWMFVADTARMRKVRADGLDLPQGLPAPAAAATLALDTEGRTEICQFDSTDGSQAAAWTPVAGTDADGNPSNVPTQIDVIGGGPVGDTVEFQATGATTAPYNSWWGMARVLNLDVLTTLGQPASEDDLIHLWVNMSHPHLIDEMRIYFVCGVTFDPTILPGTDTDLGTRNTDAYVKSFRKNDFARFIQAEQAQIDAAETARIQGLRDTDLRSRAIDDDRTSWQAARAERDPNRVISEQAAGAARAWVEFGAVGRPLRRSDFERLGSTLGRDWMTITGIIIYVQVNDGSGPIGVAFDDAFMRGGYGPDTAEPGAQQYDYRYTDYDPRTGAESNGSPEMAAANFTDSLRRRILVTPAAAGDSALRQRVYRRGGSLIDDWYFCGVNGSNGGVFQDGLSDDAVVAAGTLPIDHFQPVPTVDDAGATVLAQPVRAQWGPLEGMLFACGDPYRPGHLYYCLPDAPDHWSASGNIEICAPSEELMNGGIAGAQGYVFSRRTLYLIYPGLTSTGSVNYTPTTCQRGMFGYWAHAVGPGGIYFVAEDGVFVTGGGVEQWISRDIDPLFRDETKYGYAPIDKAAPNALRLTVWESKLYFQYQDTSGARRCMVYDILEKAWRAYQFGQAHSGLQGLDEDDLLIGGLNQGTTYTLSGTSDAGTAITCTARTASHSGGRREEKLLGDQILDVDRDGINLTLQNLLNEETVVNTTQGVTEGTGRVRQILDSFGTEPQRVRSIATEVTWSSSSGRPKLYQLGTAITINPEVTSDRVTNWDDLGHPDESWVTGITLDVDTFDQPRTVVIERDFAGVVSVVDTITVQTNTRHKVKFSWAALPAHQVRIRPSDECKFWVLYRADWIALPEPPRISKWDIHFENSWDQYYTGLDLYCDTLGQEKRVEVYVDEVQLTDPFTGNTYFSVTANGRRVVHLTFLAGRGHVFRFKAIDDNVGLLYTHRWHLQEEPSEQANWNQNFSILGSRADKYLKAVIFECDTFGQNKSVRIEVDNTVVETLTVNTSGRLVRQIALTEQKLGRVWRMYPADGNPGRLYSAQPVFDEEPFCLDRWETQESNHGLPGWFYLTYGHVTLKSAQDVTLRVTMMVNQSGATVVKDYRIPATGNEKQRRYVTFQAVKGVLVKYLLFSETAFWLYQEETNLYVHPWGAGEPVLLRPFGNSDVDPTRSMVNAVLAAGRSGGGTS